MSMIFGQMPIILVATVRLYACSCNCFFCTQVLFFIYTKLSCCSYHMNNEPYQDHPVIEVFWEIVKTFDSHQQQMFLK